MHTGEIHREASGGESKTAFEPLSVVSLNSLFSSHTHPCVWVCGERGQDCACVLIRKITKETHRIATYKTGACSLEGAKYIHDHKNFL